jgi:type I restriction enzyme, R subunit
VERVVDRTLDPARQRGLVWHTQGSGKTFTMMKAAELILRHPSLERPTVVMLVDRNELESQLFGNLTAHGMAAEVAGSKRHLRELLASDYRGLIVSMIHKFDKADADLCTRDNVVVLVDEAHRTTGGDLGNYLVGALPNATLIGFTGTPVDKTAYGQGTFKTFGKDDHPKGYLDKYSIADSVADGTTLELHYTLAPNEIRVPREILEREFLALKETEGISDIEELNKILEEAVVLKTFLKAPDRVARVARFVADHFRENVDPLGYKAFVVGVDREACALYKKALDKHLPPEWSEVVYTSAHNDSELLDEFRLGPDDEKKIRKAFTKRDAFPKILIVTEKLLTGFDAPVLYCMYLDKPMRDHTLLQAIARVNRPYEDERGIAKPCGFVVDFVGIFEKLQDALSFDSDEVSSVIKNVDVLKTRFERLMTQEARPYLALCKVRVDDKAVERAIEALADKKRREAFFDLFDEIETLYEVLSPDAFLRPWIDDFASLCVLYRIARNAFASRTLLLKDLMRKTEALLKQHASSTGVDGTLPVVEIDEQTLRALKESGANDKAKVVNLGRSLIHTIQTGGGDAPHLVLIGERAEAILEEFGERQEETEKALQDIHQLAEDYLDARAEADGAGFDPNTFAMFWVLRNAGLATARELAATLNEVFVRRPSYRDNPAELRLLKADIYKILLPTVGKDRMVGLADELLRLPRA